MATTRAKRLERFLNKKLGWTTRSTTSRCTKCQWPVNMEHVFCGNCGHKLPKNRGMDDGVFDELESAISYALGETKK